MLPGDLVRVKRALDLGWIRIPAGAIGTVHVVCTPTVFRVDFPGLADGVIVARAEIDVVTRTEAAAA